MIRTETVTVVFNDLFGCTELAGSLRHRLDMLAEAAKLQPLRGQFSQAGA